MTKLVRLEEWLTIDELADQLGCSTRWIEYRIAESKDWPEQKRFPKAMIAGRWKFRQSEVERWLEAHGHLRKEGAA